MGNMMRIVATAFIMILCYTTGVLAVEGQESRSAYGGTGGARMQIAQTVTTQVEQPPVVATPEKILAYSKGGISFKYDNLMTISSDEEPEGLTIKIECDMSPMVAIQEYRSQTNPAAVLGTLVDSLKAALKERKVIISDDNIKDVTMKIGPNNQTGKSIEFSIGGLEHKTNLFAIATADRTIGLIFQHSLDDTELAKRQFGIIVESLMIQ